MKVILALDERMLQPALDLPLYFWAADSFAYVGIRSFVLCCTEEIFEAVSPSFVGMVVRSDDIQQEIEKADDRDIVVEAPTLITRFGATILCSGKTVEGNNGCFPAEDAAQIVQAQDAVRTMVVAQHLQNGVIFVDENNAYIDPMVTIGAGTVIQPGTIIKGYSRIGSECRIGPFCYIDSCVVEDGASINQSQIYECRVGKDTTVGPFAYIRPGSVIGDDCKIGDFVEVKNSTVGDGTKFSHLTYVGDADIGKNVNMGCGCVTVNYDGLKKYRTRVGDNAFIGCNTNLIAPVSVGQGAYIAAGSTITDNVPAQALSIARARQVNKPGRGSGRTKNT